MAAKQGARKDFTVCGLRDGVRSDGTGREEFGRTVRGLYNVPRACNLSLSRLEMVWYSSVMLQASDRCWASNSLPRALTVCPHLVR